MDTGYPYSNALLGSVFAYGEDNKKQINHARYKQIRVVRAGHLAGQPAADARRRVALSVPGGAVFAGRARWESSTGLPIIRPRPANCSSHCAHRANGIARGNKRRSIRRRARSIPYVAAGHIRSCDLIRRRTAVLGNRLSTTDAISGTTRRSALGRASVSRGMYSATARPRSVAASAFSTAGLLWTRSARPARAPDPIAAPPNFIAPIVPQYYDR